uniref:Hemerythrin n=1 Tax=Mesochaetopterus taylori TaxID=352254 RepID=A0A1S6QCN0_9ANNE|nr:hemerythrin [Mesochaetopterus taylori]
MSFSAVPCSHAVPSPFVWKSSFQVFYDNLDAEHQGLFDGIRKLKEDSGKSSQKSNLEHLIQILDEHFKDEEMMMKKKNFYDHDSHKKTHDDFLSVMRKVTPAQVNDKLFEHASTWLVSHIMDTDMKYKGEI